ncbi:hypothetical protein HN992_01670 [Candidatus Woesearchaeota archaeon]|jgi:hypothetical protein|nr:hypothetical protein [Candidatus Woesearchaeota archaeon]MBT3438619.1 hypothetical protein [Candidatus Woesearchaeota archaeon]MBT4058483.1 hypothetical protein [Candidatus Woesearchaeota archaeon]MBT4207304.1 hypothetical protein [Candidatus Woesearchaeota archaeon]MBT4730961.1 hypothetical protein [Candidatus Woesearchaeota archaeon]
MARTKTLENNLERLLGEDLIRSDFHEFLITECAGGNAGTYYDVETGKEHLCIAGNFHADETGKIIKFTNHASNEGTYELGFRVVLDDEYKSGYSKIIDCYSYSGKELPTTLKNVIAGTVMGYNYQMRKAKK